MIASLSIQNYALIHDVQVTFKQGLTSITGETGAGKSILLGALGMVLGNRADISSNRQADKKCVVEATFNIVPYNLKVHFETLELDYEDETILRREITPSGKSRAFVNDTPVTLKQLQALGVHLVHIHSQHQTLSIQNEAYQIEVLDFLAQTQPLRETYKAQKQIFESQAATLKALRLRKEDAKKDEDYLRFQLKELQEVGLETIDMPALESTQSQLANIETIQDALQQLLQLLEEEHMGVLQQLNTIKQAIFKIQSFATPYQLLSERLQSVQIELEDISQEAHQLANALEADPQQLEIISKKLQQLFTLQQKHNVASIQDLINIKQRLEAEVSTTENLDEDIQTLEKEYALSEKKLNALATNLSKRRQAILPDFEAELVKMLSLLGMPHAHFKMQFKPSSGYKVNGKDDFDILFSANKGAAPESLKKVASGGELSRIMLVIKALTAKHKKLPTLIFDEIDSGVSGEISNRMGDIMQEMSRNMQVFSITHLPQIASKGDHHFKVYNVL